VKLTRLTQKKKKKNNEFCQEAFQHQCWKEDEFAGCCDNCAEGTSTFQCSWNFSYRWGPGEDARQTLKELVIGNSSNACFCDKACEILGNPTNNPCWYCMDPPHLPPYLPQKWLDMLQNMNACPGAFKFPADRKPGWCTGCPLNPSATEELSPGRNTIFAAGGATFAFVAMLAVMAMLKSRRRTGEPLLHEGH